MMREIYNSKYKSVFEDPKTGKIKVIVKDQRFRESIARGDALQPYGKDERKFFEINKHLKKTKTGEIINPEQLKQKQKEYDEEAEKELKEDFQKKHESLDRIKYKKYF